MIGGLRALLRRPIVPDRRRLAFAVAATVVAAVALVPLLAERSGREGRTPARPLARGPGVVAPRPAVTTARTRARMQRDAAADADDARSLVRSFLPSYLAYAYGRRDARKLREHVHETLWLELTRRRPRVPPHLRELRPRVTHLRITATRPGAVRFEATVDDGERRYTIPVVAAELSGRWQIVSVWS